MASESWIDESCSFVCEKGKEDDEKFDCHSKTTFDVREKFYLHMIEKHSDQLPCMSDKPAHACWSKRFKNKSAARKHITDSHKENHRYHQDFIKIVKGGKTGAIETFNTMKEVIAAINNRRSTQKFSCLRHDIETVPVKVEDLQDFSKLTDSLMAKGMHLDGITKLRPPSSYRARAQNSTYEETLNLRLPASYKYLSQKLSTSDSNEGIGKTISDLKKTDKHARLKNYYRKESDGTLNETASKKSQIEEELWRDPSARKIYASYLLLSLWPKEGEGLNLKNLQEFLKTSQPIIHGVHTSMLYVGSKGSFTGWHCEDSDLLSVAYLHYGQPKLWMAINPKDADKFKTFCRREFSEEFRACPEFLRHKGVMISSETLRKNGIRVTSTLQYEGDIIITWPQCFHSVINSGSNIMESINIGIADWIMAGIASKVCVCTKKNNRDGTGGPTPSIKMLEIVEKHKPEWLQEYKEGRLVHDNPWFPGQWISQEILPDENEHSDDEEPLEPPLKKNKTLNL